MTEQTQPTGPAHAGYTAHNAGSACDANPYPYPGVQRERGSDWKKWRMGWMLAHHAEARKATNDAA